MLLTAHFILKITVILYAIGLGIFIFSGERYSRMKWFFIPALIANGSIIAIRYWLAWPMLPMHLGGIALPLFLCTMALCSPSIGENRFVQRNVFVLAVLLSVLVLCFPKDYYLPFLKTRTLFSHFFLLFSVLGKTCFLISATWSFSGMVKQTGITRIVQNQSWRWTIWGFAFWTLSMFSGEIWAYLGWGTPVIWEDPAVATAMATWFFYICLMHLHLTGKWLVQQRGMFAAFGGVIVMLSCISDFGPFRWPF